MLDELWRVSHECEEPVLCPVKVEDGHEVVRPGLVQNLDCLERAEGIKKILGVEDVKRSFFVDAVQFRCLFHGPFSQIERLVFCGGELGRFNDFSCDSGLYLNELVLSLIDGGPTRFGDRKSVV